MKQDYIYKGDCISILNNDILENSISLIFADPPYNLSGKNLKLTGSKTGGDWFKVNEDWDNMEENEYFEFTDSRIKASKRVLKENGSIYISATYHNLGEILMSLKRYNFKIINIITRYKSNAMPNITKRSLTHSCEYIVRATKGKGRIFNYDISKKINPDRQKDGSKRQMRDMWTIPVCQGPERLKGKDGRALHPTQKPEELLKRIILISSNEGDVILDPFNGSGTTTLVAKKYGRKYIGIEKNEDYYLASIERMKKESNKLFF